MTDISRAELIAELTAELADGKLTLDDILSLRKTAADSISANVDAEKRQAQKDLYSAELTKFKTKLEKLTSEFIAERAKDCALISKSIAKHNDELSDRINKIRLIDSLALTSNKPGSTSAQYVVVFGITADVQAFLESRTLENLNKLDGSAGFSNIKRVRNKVSYPELFTRYHKVVDADKGVRRFVAIFNDNRRNVSGARCFDDDLSASLRDKDSTTGLRFSAEECQRASVQMTNFSRLENRCAEHESIAILQRSSIESFSS